MNHGFNLGNLKHVYKMSPRSKMGNIRTVYNGHTYDSIKEAKFAQDLDLRLKAKDIKQWKPHIKFPIIVNEKKICTYILDFIIENNDGTIEYIDIKPFDKRKQRFLLKDVYVLKKKLIEAIYNIQIQEK